MISPIPLPDWLPWWVPILLLAPVLLYGLMFLFMPFGILGVKARLEAIEARLDEIQGEIRRLVLRMPEPLPGSHFDEAYTPPAASAGSRSEPVLTKPPIPPAFQDMNENPGSDMSADRSFGDFGDRGTGTRRSTQLSRAEPRLQWPR
jgi:hypothetical protein